jgi:hypothetical protein
MVKELVELINRSLPPTSATHDKDRVTIRCLPHVLHLTVTDLMKALKSLAEDDELDISQEALTEEEAERLHAESKAGEEEEGSEAPLSDTDLGSAILKVSVVSVYARKFNSQLTNRLDSFQNSFVRLRSAPKFSRQPSAFSSLN